MNKQVQNLIYTIGAIIIAGGAFLYGALTAPRSEPTRQTPAVTTTATPKPQSVEQSRDTIMKIITTEYPKITTDYTVAKGTFYENNTWYGTTLTYKGEDSMNRDTLRILMEKKDGLWVLRTKPPVPILSKHDYPDVPVKILQAINQPVSLPSVDTPPSSDR